MLLSPDGTVTALIVGVGGFLGIGEKDVAVPFNAIKHESRDGKVYLTMSATKDELKSAPGLVALRPHHDNVGAGYRLTIGRRQPERSAKINDSSLKFWAASAAHFSC